ncbi:sodium-coupled monocarboxylate transporter 1-like [Mercenaria mercenaria]|uniref:sodium-coupled monocarboxylate transporter 1-like n=1 Tax=Mercenaria mercenaria TaxID=6596 RepID=UPI00234EFFEE|nr:sodium-coupled monocarboxylate transporter 1-like [Mercenaria mercenaria]
MAATFQALDYILFVAVLLISALVGIYYILKEKWAVKQATSDDLLMGGREMAVFPVAMSLIASYMSAITVLGIPTEMYVFGAQYWLVALSGLMTYPVTCHVFLPFFHSMQLSSAYQYLELRFNRAARYLASTIFAIEMVLYMAVVLYAPSLALNQVTGLSLWGSILSVGAVVTFYTSMGGLRAVLWTDTFQTLVVIAGLIGIISIGSSQLGGITKVWEIADAGGRINFWNFNISPFVRCTFWGLTIGSFIGQLTIYGANQTMLQRYMSISDVKKSQLALYVSLPVTMGLVSLVCIAGLVIYAAYHDCDPFLDGKLIARDQLLPYYVMETLGHIPGVPGLFVACIFSAALSSISSCLNALSITVLEDMIKPATESWNFKFTPDEETRLAKILGIFGGVLVILFAFLATVLGTTVLQIMISVLGMAGGPLLGLFLMGMFLPCVNAKGAISGLVVSTVVIFGIVIGAYFYQAPQPELPFQTSGCVDHTISGLGGYVENEIYLESPHPVVFNDARKIHEDSGDEWGGVKVIFKLSFLWYPTLAIGIALVVGIFVSWCTGWTNTSLNPRYIYPVSQDLLCCLPWSIQRRLNCSSWWTYNVRKVDSILSDSDDSGDEELKAKHFKKTKKGKVKVVPRYTDRIDSFDADMSESEI